MIAAPLIGTLFFVYGIREILFWVSLWQLKEYRLDRLWVHLRDTKQGMKLVFSINTGLLILLLLLFIAVSVWEQIYSFYFYLVLVFFLYELIFTLRKVLQHAVKRPINTVKSMSIVFLSIATILGLLFLPLIDFFAWTVCLALLLPFIVAVYVFLFSFPTEIYTDLYLQKAKRKRESLKKLTVIAVSGSYGKSSTKEIIAHVLSQKYNVEKTLLSQNTPYAVARTIIKQVTNSTDFLIAELGAYKKGEIEQMAKVVKPTISVTTAVSDQHLALYGGMKEVVESEMELIRLIPKKSFVLFNGNSEYMHLLSEQTKGAMFWYKTSTQSKTPKNTIVAYDVKPSHDGVSFEVSFQGKHLSLHSPLLGIHTVENILPAIFLALNFGLSDKEIIDGINSLKPLPKTMEKKEILPNVTVIDDTFNASPESVSAAIDYLKLFPKRKILVMSPLIELGKHASERHQEIGQALAGIDIVMLTNKNFLNDMKNGIEKMGGKTEIICDTYHALALYVKQNMQKGDAIVFEGKEAGIVLHYL